MDSKESSKTSPRASPLSWASRKQYHGSLTVGLNPDSLEQFLTCDLLKYCRDHRLQTLAHLQCRGLAQRLKSTSIDNNRLNEDLNNVATILGSFLELSPQNNRKHLPASVIYASHSYLGLVNAVQHNQQAARMHFLKALWIVSSTSSQQQLQGGGGEGNTSNSHSSIPREQLAITMHRLAKAYASSRLYHETKGLLDKALKCYAIHGVPNDHPCVVEAHRLLAVANGAIQASAQAAAARAQKRLSYISEESAESNKSLD